MLFTGLANSLYSTKGGLAWLSDESVRGSFSAAEIAVIDRIVPWTRMLVSDAGDLTGYCRDQRDELMLKPRAVQMAIAATEARYRVSAEPIGRSAPAWP